MAAGLTLATLRSGAALVLAVAAAAACAGPSGLPLQPGQPRPTPLASLPAELEPSARAIRARLAAVGYVLDEAAREYRPAEPAALQAVPRAVMRIRLPDPDAGWLLLYHLGSDEDADAAADAFAAYLAGNFGQARYPPDAQFVLNRLDSSVLFGWWAPSRLTAPDAARAAFEALRDVGRSVPVRR